MSSKISFIVSALMTKYGLDEASAEKFAALMFDVIAKGLKADRQVKVKRHVQTRGGGVARKRRRQHGRAYSNRGA